MNQILTRLRLALFSLFSDGALSLKRVLSFLFGVVAMYMAIMVTYRAVPATNQNLFEHVFDGLLLIIGGLLGVGAWQTVSTLKTQKKVEQTTVDTPTTSTTQTTITPPEQ